MVQLMKKTITLFLIFITTNSLILETVGNPIPLDAIIDIAYHNVLLGTDSIEEINATDFVRFDEYYDKQYLRITVSTNFNEVNNYSSFIIKDGHSIQFIRHFITFYIEYVNTSLLYYTFPYSINPDVFYGYNFTSQIASGVNFKIHNLENFTNNYEISLTVYEKVASYSEDDKFPVWTLILIGLGSSLILIALFYLIKVKSKSVKENAE